MIELWEKKREAISALDTKLYGFNILPSLHRIKPFQKFPGGFTNFTFNATFGGGAGPA